MKLGLNVYEKAYKAKTSIHDLLLSERIEMPCFGILEWIEQTSMFVAIPLVRIL